MKLCVYFLAILSSSLALPSPVQELAWEDIKGENVYIEPISNYTVDASVGGRVIGGMTVTPNSVPYQVAIYINGRSFCGGSLISRNFVLTAAHCTVSASFVELIFGAHNVQAAESTQVRVTSMNIINHGQYNPSTLLNDVALVRIPSAISLNANIQIVALAPATAGTYAGSVARLTGWGRISDAIDVISPTLGGVNLNIITNSVCASSFGNIIQSSTICTSGAGIVGACNGDSGGPLTVNGIQVGVTSFVAYRGCELGLPSGFARVSAFRSWIAANSDVSL
ncbi:brachyurin [Anoplophora glabripennis]|uniref:brachyurin n=1 Tax=Anoplophora glabripennis TaxID=217634 RepID=UPI0008757E83|nr:brachyurin [Anoplophora glabripennis]